MDDVLKQFIKNKRGPVETYTTRIEEMMNDERYEFAQETLTGIYDFIIMNDHVTQKQMDAVDKIKMSLWNR